MKTNLIIIAFFILTGCTTINRSHFFYVGTYTNTESQGIYKYSLNEDGTLDLIGLSAKSENPSFLVKSTDKKHLIAVNETNNNNGSGTVESYLIRKDSLEFLSRSSSGGAHPCFVTVNKEGFVLTANYSEGNVGLLKIDNNGKLSPLLDIEQHIGKGTTKRQQAPHVHSAWFEPKDNSVISVDLGTNELWFSSIDSKQQKLIPSEAQKLKMNDGAGPRHLTIHPNKKWIYVVNELDCTVVLVQKSENGLYKKGKSISTLPVGYKKPNTCADIHISSDGKFLYVSNRGHNSIAIYEVDKKDGSLTLLNHQTTLGDGPRNFSLSPDENHLLVANQHSNNIVSFKRNKTNGLLYFVDQIEAHTPVCILF